jgi:hypothetical protein
MTGMSYLTKIKNIQVANSEEIILMCDAEKGICNEPTSKNALIAVTTERLLLFSSNVEKTDIVLKKHISAITINKMIKGFPLVSLLAVLVMTLIVYIGASLWVTETASTTYLPGINMELGPLLLLIGLSVSLGLVFSNFLKKDQVLLKINAGAVVYTFVCRSKHYHDLHKVVNLLS